MSVHEDIVVAINELVDAQPGAVTPDTIAIALQ